MKTNKETIAKLIISCFILSIIAIGMMSDTYFDKNLNKTPIVKNDSIIYCPKITNETKIVHFGYNGHDYIDFQYQSYGRNNMDHCVVHDPDCHCFEDQNKLVNQMLNEYYD